MNCNNEKYNEKIPRNNNRNFAYVWKYLAGIEVVFEECFKAMFREFEDHYSRL